MRAFSSSIMALLVVAALFWGNCYSCPQALLGATTHQCCHPTKAPKDCPSPTLHNYVKSDAAAAPAPLGPVATVSVEPAPPVSFSEVSARTAEYTPPDRLSLNSSFRI